MIFHLVNRLCWNLYFIIIWYSTWLILSFPLWASISACLGWFTAQVCQCIFKPNILVFSCWRFASNLLRFCELCNSSLNFTTSFCIKLSLQRRILLRIVSYQRTVRFSVVDHASLHSYHEHHSDICLKILEDVLIQDLVCRPSPRVPTIFQTRHFLIYTTIFCRLAKSLESLSLFYTLL